MISVPGYGNHCVSDFAHPVPHADELEDRARAMGADAVVGIDVDYEVLGEGGGMLMVTASGTAVRLG